jgi:hypothetical protein
MLSGMDLLCCLFNKEEGMLLRNLSHLVEERTIVPVIVAAWRKQESNKVNGVL